MKTTQKKLDDSDSGIFDRVAEHLDNQGTKLIRKSDGGDWFRLNDGIIVFIPNK